MHEMKKNKTNLTGPKGYSLVMLLCMGAGMVGGLGVAMSEMAPGVWSFWIALGAMLVAMTAGMIVCVKWWSQIDEAAREAHKWAWWVGGNIGLAAGLVVMMALLYRGEAIGLTDVSGVRAMANGMGLMLLFPLAGYSAAWLFWWFQRR